MKQTFVCVVNLFLGPSGQTFEKVGEIEFNHFQIELLSEQLVAKTAAPSQFKLPISVSGKTTGRIYD